jgi:signal transduction histidine kinase
VRDNGIGFSPKPASRGLGLRTMEQRARLIGGRLNVIPHPDGGTEVLCSVSRAVVERVHAG